MTLPRINGDFEVLPENWETVQVFCAVSTQWRVGTGGVVGLDYNALFQVMALYDISDRKSVFDGIRVMEATMLEKANS